MRNRELIDRVERLEAEVEELRKQVYTALSGLAPKPRPASTSTKTKTF
jgi:hypothetical protein